MAKKTSTPVQKQHNRSPLRLYFLLTTLTGLIGSLVAVGILIFTVGKFLIITNEEYIMGDRYYELESCSQDMYKPTASNQNNYVKPTEEEKAKCKEEKKTQLIQSRKALFKQDLVGGITWSVLFLMVLLIHYPKFMRTKQEK